MRAESDARIIAAAIEAFAERGYHRTTLAQIGQAAGYTGALISRRYGSKADLTRAVFAHILQRFTPLEAEDGTTRQVDPDTSARHQLEDFIADYLQDAVDAPTRVRAMYVLLGESLGGMNELTAEIAHVNQVFRDYIASCVRLGQQQREFRSDLHPDQTAVIVAGTLRGVVTQLLAEPDAFDPVGLAIELRRSSILPLLATDEDRDSRPR
jgi:AcrR family transcriptional regulator